MESKIYLIRHGESTDNRDIISSGERDVSLSEKGIEEAKELARQLQDVEFDKVYTSPLKRCTETVDVIMAGKRPTEIVKDARIRERSYGILEGKKKFGLPFYMQWIRDITRRSYFLAPPKGENFIQVWNRVYPFIQELEADLKRKPQSVLICAHHNSMRPIKSYFGKIPYRQVLIDPASDKDIKIYTVKVEEPVNSNI